MWCVVLVGEGEVKVAGGVERNAESLELDARHLGTGAAEEGCRMGRRAAGAAAAKPPRSRAERSHDRMVVVVVVVYGGSGGGHGGS